MDMKLFGILSLSVLPQIGFAEVPSFTTGLAETTNPGLIDCGRGSRESAVGEIASDDGASWTVPAETNFLTGPKAYDLYNECADVERASIADLDLADVPIADAGGSEVFTAYIFADNYFELSVNGQLVAVDPVPFTPFNSNVVRFTADRPVTLAIKGVDWEENLGIGSERGKGSSFSPGDAGIVAQIVGGDGSVAAITDASWKAQTYYVSPIIDQSCISVEGGLRDSSACSLTPPKSADGVSGAHWALPEGWEQPDFDDSSWPGAYTFTNDTVGIDNKAGFTNFEDIFDAPDQDPQFIWSSNLVLDNLVLMRKTIE